jgi:hypothetical protein
MAARRRQARADDGFVRETVAARRGAGSGEGDARSLAGSDLHDCCRDLAELPGGEIEFTMKRLRSAD